MNILSEHQGGIKERTVCMCVCVRELKIRHNSF